MADPCAQRIQRGGWAEDLALGRCHWPIGPRNFWSNAAYLLVAAVLVLRRRDPATLAMAAALVVLGIGSAWYHGWKTLAGNRADWVGMLATFSALVVHGIIPESRLAPGLMVALGATAGWYFALELNGVPVNGVMGLCLVLGSLRPLLIDHAAVAIASLAVFGLAYVIWQLDKHRSRLVGVWGHASWHVLAALAIGLLFVAQR